MDHAAFKGWEGGEWVDAESEMKMWSDLRRDDEVVVQGAGILHEDCCHSLLTALLEEEEAVGTVTDDSTAKPPRMLLKSAWATAWQIVYYETLCNWKIHCVPC